MSGNEEAQFLEWYEGQKDKIFRNKKKFLAYYMDDVNVLKQGHCVLGILF